MKKYSFLTLFILILKTNGFSQAFSLSDFFTEYPALRFYSSDSDNMIFNEILSYDDLKNTIKKECPFSIENSEHLNDIIPFNTITTLPGLHNQVPNYDSVLQEVKGLFAIDTFVKNWYSYYSKSTVDSTVAFFIIPGFGIHNGWHIAAADSSDYENIPIPIRDKCLQFGDVYSYVKPNEDFRSIWKDVGAPYLMKLDYDYFTPFTDLHGIHWAANMQIECTAAIKCLKLKYNKVIILGLSNGGIPALIAGIEGAADGINCASGLSITDYDGFLLPNNENPYFYNQFKKYSLDSLKTKMANSPAYYLFSYGANDFGTNAFEYNTHSLQDTFATLNHTCHIDFNYNFIGHHFPVYYLDTFFNRVIHDSCGATMVQNPSGFNSQTISIYPNPTKKNIVVKSETGSIQSVQLFTLSGDEILNLKNIQTIETTISLPQLASGNYIINVITKNKNFAQMIRVE